MVMGDILNVELDDQFSVNMNHLGFIYCLDVDKDGWYYLDDLQAFGQEAMEQI